MRRQSCDQGGKLAGIVAVMLALAGVAAGQAWAEEATAQARGIISKWEKAVVTVKMVVKTRMVAEGREVSKEEGTNEATGTVIDPSGLVVVSLSEADPAQMLKQLMGEEQRFKVETEVSEVKLRLADGKELPAKIVLRDKDLDLAFVRPTTKPTAALPAVSLTDEAKPQLLDEVLILGRLGEIAGRTVAASLDRIQAIITKPRTFYVPGTEGVAQSLGSPVFSLDGKLVGVLLLRTIAASGGGRGLLGSMSRGEGMLPVVLPAADVLEASKQAPK